MSASLPVNMRGPQVKTPLLLLLLLLATLTATDQLPSVSYATLVPHPYSEEQTVEEITEEDPGSGQGRFYPGNDVPEATADPSFMGPNTTSKVNEEDLSIIIILIPVVVVVVIIALIVCGVFITCRWNKKTRDDELKKEDPYLDGSSTEKVPMPMFEEDVPSVLEVEMDELDQWMKKDG